MLFVVPFVMPAMADEPSLELVVRSDAIPEALPVPIGVEFALLSDGTVFYQEGGRIWGGFQTPRLWIGRMTLDRKDALLSEVTAKLRGLDGLVSRCPDDRDTCARLCELLKADFPSSKGCLGFTHDAPSATIRYRSSDDGAEHFVAVFGYPVRASTNYYTAPDGFSEVYRMLEQFAIPEAREWRDGPLRVELVDAAGVAVNPPAEWPAEWPRARGGDFAVICAPQSSLDDRRSWVAMLDRYVKDRDEPDRIWYVKGTALDLPKGLAEALGMSPVGMGCR
ncbi:MAG TPA: hypothetical protein VJV39_18825 [Dongiaceae bacterium]|nr:hypothetical protein [Dongiaceae bacterium]